MNKKGYYFTLDALISVVILAIGFSLINSTYVSSPSSSAIEHISDDIFDLMSSGIVGNFNYSSLSLIENKGNTFLEAIGEKYYNDGEFCEGTCILGLNQTIQEIIIGNKIVSENHGFSMSIEDIEIYSVGTNHLEKTRALVSSKRIVFGYYEDEGTGDIDFWGPYEMEVRTWQIG